MLKMDDLFEPILDLEKRLGQMLNQCEKVSAEQLGLDRRAARKVWVGEDFIAIPINDYQRFEYYGGFEYHQARSKYVSMEYAIYIIEHDEDRVGRALDRLREAEEV